MLLLIALLLVQNIAISGTLKDADGKSLKGVRVAAQPVNGTLPFESAITDKEGRYTLELPPGAYYVVAGNGIVRPTYYTVYGSRVVISTSRDRVDFVVNTTSSRSLWRREELLQWPTQWDVPPTPPKFPPSLR